MLPAAKAYLNPCHPLGQAISLFCPHWAALSSSPLHLPLSAICQRTWAGLGRRNSCHRPMPLHSCQKALPNSAKWHPWAAGAPAPSARRSAGLCQGFLPVGFGSIPNSGGFGGSAPPSFLPLWEASHKARALSASTSTSIAGGEVQITPNVYFKTAAPRTPDFRA